MSEVGVEHVMRGLKVDIGGRSGDGDVGDTTGSQHFTVGHHSHIAFPASIVFGLNKEDCY